MTAIFKDRAMNNDLYGVRRISSCQKFTDVSEGLAARIFKLEHKPYL